jgi:hypothetical protein
LGLRTRYRLRLERKRLLWRAFRKRRQLSRKRDRTAEIRDGHILLFATLRNEKVRLAYFLDYYRKLGVDHFLMVDNGSDDGSAEYLAEQPDVSLWTTKASYRRSRFGMDWQNWLLNKYGHRHWCLCVDVDEFLVYPFCDTRPLAALTDWMDASSLRVCPAMLLDMYPKGPIDAQPYAEGQDPFEIAAWFDSGNYTIERNDKYGNLWIQGGPRARAFFADQPNRAPALNKLPLVRWQKGYAYLDSTHMMLPRGLNLAYEEGGGEKFSGILLHAKFLHTFVEKSAEEIRRQQHYGKSREYKAYARQLGETQPDLWHSWSERYINWRQLEILGLMSKGNWA